MSKRDNINQIIACGIAPDDARALRRISLTLRRWHELECGTGEGQVSISVERDENEKPFLRTQYPTKTGYVDRRAPVPDRERGALKRLAAIMARYSELASYVQGDPRGCALYILRPGDVPAGEDPGAYYSCGIPVY
jgi:hypothetical protein